MKKIDERLKKRLMRLVDGLKYDYNEKCAPQFLPWIGKNSDAKKRINDLKDIIKYANNKKYITRKQLCKKLQHAYHEIDSLTVLQTIHDLVLHRKFVIKKRIKDTSLRKVYEF